MTLTQGGAFPVSPAASREDLIAMIHNRDALVADLKEAVADRDSKLEAYRKALASGVNELNAIAIFAEDNSKAATDKHEKSTWAAHARAIREVASALAAGG